jgi:transcriptional regulator with PAS, ATPase and Fis domain
MDLKWLDGIEGNITVCDLKGIIVYMNARSAESFKDRGGMSLIGKSLFDCHQETSNIQIQEMLRTGASNVYTVEKKGKRKFVWQAPWLENGVCKGLVEITMPIPSEIRHIVRDNQTT